MTPRDITVSVTARLQPAHSESNINFIFAEIHGKIVKRGYDTVDGRRAFGVVFSGVKGRQLRIHCSDSVWSFATNRISATQITTTQMAQTEIK